VYHVEAHYRAREGDKIMALSDNQIRAAFFAGLEAAVGKEREACLAILDDLIKEMRYKKNSMQTYGPGWMYCDETIKGLLVARDRIEQRSVKIKKDDDDCTSSQ
jgi:hypothetical protein